MKLVRRIKFGFEPLFHNFRDQFADVATKPRHFPHLNLARIYRAKGMIVRAIEEYEAALALHPGDPACLRPLRELRGKLN